MTEALAGLLVLPDRVLEGVVAIDGDRLGYVGPASGWTGPTPRPVPVIAPGFVDVHCHGGGGKSLTVADPDELRSAAGHHLERGTTTVVASLVSAPAAEISDAVAAIADVTGLSEGPAIAGSHLEGPFIGPGHRGAHDASHLRDPDVATTREWLSRGRGTVRMMTLAPELRGADEVASLLRAAGAIAAYGHTDADAATFAAALAAGADHGMPALVTHLFNGMEPMHHRTPGPVAASLAALRAGRTRAELIADGIHLADETVRMVFEIAPPGGVVLVSDAMAAAGLTDGDYRLGTLEVRVADGVARVVHPDGSVGSIAGSTIHLADAVRRCVVDVGLDPVDVVAAATATPAEVLGLRDRGRLAAGLLADLVVLGEDWRVTEVIHRGAPVPRPTPAP